MKTVSIITIRRVLQVVIYQEVNAVKVRISIGFAKIVRGSTGRGNSLFIEMRKDIFSLDSGIRRFVKILNNAGLDTLASCQGRKRPGYHPDRDGSHHGDWPYILLNGTSADAYKAVGVALEEGLPVRSIEQSWFIYPEDPKVLSGPQWRITFWKKDSSNKSYTHQLHF